MIIIIFTYLVITTKYNSHIPKSKTSYFDTIVKISQFNNLVISNYLLSRSANNLVIYLLGANVFLIWCSIEARVVSVALFFQLSFHFLEKKTPRTTLKRLKNCIDFQKQEIKICFGIFIVFVDIRVVLLLLFVLYLYSYCIVFVFYS